MKFKEISTIRLRNQHIIETEANTVADVVYAMGAIQAQDHNMARWAIGSRLPSSTNKMVEKAFNDGEIVRTHLLRPTWHIVSAKDIRWMLELTAPQIRTVIRSRDKNLELDEAIYKKSHRILEKLLTGNNHLTRDEIVVEWAKAKIRTDDNRAAHILMRAELDGLICSGSSKNRKLTYALLEERLPRTDNLTKDEALHELARRYFTSRGPATLKDFIWWSGLPVKDVKCAVEMLGEEFNFVVIDEMKFWFNSASGSSEKVNSNAYLLPAFDEFIIAYTDRSASLPPEINRKVVSNNGIFWPIVVVNGQVTGIWRRVISKNKAVIEAQVIRMPDKKTTGLITKNAERYAHFHGHEVDVSFSLL